MRILAGTSGWSFKEWKGSFYPKGLPDDGMLSYYAGKFPTVEINNTFYRMPKETVLLELGLEGAARRSVSRSRPRSGSPTRPAQGRGGRGGVFHPDDQRAGRPARPDPFQLPPNLKKDLPRLTEFLELLPRGWRSAFEFRHSSWFEDDVYDALRAKDAAMCIADHDDFETPAVRTASWGYARLHRLTYDDAALGGLAGAAGGTGRGGAVRVLQARRNARARGRPPRRRLPGWPRRKSHLGQKPVASGRRSDRRPRVITSRSLARVIPTYSSRRDSWSSSSGRQSRLSGCPAAARLPPRRCRPEKTPGPWSNAG